MRERRRLLAATTLLAGTALLARPVELSGAEPKSRLVVGAKKFTESAILAELMAQTLETYADVSVERRHNLAGSQVCFEALRGGDIDLYAEYTGTGLRNLLGIAEAAGSKMATFATVSQTFRERFDLVWLAPFGFNNTYVLVMQRSRAASLSIARLSDLASHPLRYGVSHEFLQRPDGMRGLRLHYQVNEASTVGLEHDLAYRALSDGAIDVADGYSTDAKLAGADLIALADDREFFPPYEAAPLTRRDVLVQHPQVGAALALLAGRIDDDTMRRLNHRVEHERLDPARVAADFLSERGVRAAVIATPARSPSLLRLLWERRVVTLGLTAQHLLLTGIAVSAACLVGIPLAVFASRRPRLAAMIVGVAGILQTIPSLALLAFMIPFFGVGARSAVVALFLYGLLPIVRNTIAGVHSVDPDLVEVGRGLGMRPRQVLRHIELPLATPIILAGVRTSTVVNIGTATLAALVGAGGLGDPIITGLTVTDTNLILSGALPAAVLAVGVDALLGGIEHVATPRGLRVRREARE